MSDTEREILAVSSTYEDSRSFSSSDLEKTIEAIGLARFVGRINSGVIPATEGYEAVKKYVAAERERPLISRLTASFFGRTEPYSEK